MPEAKAEIEVPLEVIEAGIFEVQDWCINETSVDVWLPDVFRVMLKIWLQQQGESR